jgi:catechol 2,3-dioxygenase-like lactoylglutathione lyase family enzyme
VPRHHHVNLAVQPGGIEPEEKFLTDVLGYQRVVLTEQQQAMGLRWFEGIDGAQIHLSEDPEHNAPKRAHVAVECNDDELTDVEQRLESAGIAVKKVNGPFVATILLLRDPAGNRWEIRSAN